MLSLIQFSGEHSDFEELPNDEVFGDEDYISRDSIKFSSISSMGSSDWDEFTKYNTDSKEISRKNSNSNLLEDDMREMNRMLDDKGKISLSLATSWFSHQFGLLDTNDVVEATQSVTEFLKNSGPLELNVDQLERLFHQQNFQNAAELSSVIDRNWCEIPPSTPESREAALALDEVLYYTILISY